MRKNILQTHRAEQSAPLFEAEMSKDAYRQHKIQWQNVGVTGGGFTLPDYPTVRIVTDYALTETPDGIH
jgi:hypothetical protein